MVKDDEFDIVVVGAGIAGLSAAVTAATAGLSVLVLEKASKIGGTTGLSDGAFNAVDAARQICLGVEDTPEKHWMQAWESGRQKGRPAMLKTMAYEAAKTLLWLEDLGMRFQENVVQLPGSRFPRTHVPLEGGGEKYIEVLSRALAKFRVPVLTDMSVQRLLKNRFGRVCAVEAHARLTHRTKRFHAGLGVVLASGGFANNPALLRMHGPGYRQAVILSDTGATGEAMLAASDIGAGLIGMSFFALGFKTTAYCLPIDPSKFILLNSDAKRFIREDVTQETLIDAVLRQKGSQAWLVCHNNEQDDQTVPSQFREELIEETQRYSRLSLSKAPDPLGKPASLIQPIGKPYCLSRLYPCILTSLGGLEIDTAARVIGRNGKAIRGLTAAGDVTGGIHGEKPLFGDCLASAASFGRIAAATLIREA